jgi:hypothetical protein
MRQDSSNRRKLNPFDWRIWLPRAFYLDWSNPRSWHLTFDPTIWLPLAFYPPEEIERIIGGSEISKLYNIIGDFVSGDWALPSIGGGRKEDKR